MKIVHICVSDKRGGAAIAAYRHCEAMKLAGMDSVMYVANRQRKSSYPFIKRRKISKLKFLFCNAFHSALIQRICTWGVFSFPFWGYRISKSKILQEADVIYLHWVAGGILSTSEIGKIFRLGKRVVWYLHDMNPITGGCHYAMDCIWYKEKEGCHNCPYLKHYPGMDLAAIQFKKRLKSWHACQNVEIVAPSTWLAECAKNSEIWAGHKVSVFPNVIDTHKFKPLDKTVAKKLFNVNGEKFTILFGADAINSVYKGWEYLRKAINLLDTEKYEVIIFGEENEAITEDINVRCIFTGYLSDEIALIMAYNAADVFVSSSLADNYPNVILEAMSCGIPCTGFQVGGIPDLIRHEGTGLLAEVRSAEDLAACIEKLFTSQDYYRKLSQNARAFVQKHCDYKVYQTWTGF